MKTIKIIGAIVIIGLLVFVGLKIWQHFHQAAAADDQQQLIVASKTGFAAQIDKTAKDAAGVIHTTVKSGQNTFSQSAINNNPKISLGGADTTAQILDIQRQQIESWQSLAVQSQQRALKAEKKLDSVGHLEKYYKDKYIEIVYHPGKDSTDNGLFDYKKYETVNALQYWKRNHFLGPKESYIDFSSNDPNTIISNPKMFSVTPDYGFGLKAQARAVYDFSSGTVVPSAWIIGSYKNWEAGYGYYYNQALQKPKPQASVAYNIILR